MMGSNGMMIDMMLTAYGNNIETATSQKKTKASGNFLDEVEHKLECKNKMQGTEDTDGASVKEMTPEQYKQYIYDKISQIPIHPSQRLNSISIHISDSGFEAMQKDPEYEKWVLDTLTCDFGFYNPWANLCGGSFVVHTFGATKEEYHGEGWFKGYQNGRGQALFNEKAEDSFWERRLRHKKLMKERNKLWQEKKWMEDKRLQKMYEQEMINRSMEERCRITGRDYQSPERRLPIISTAYQTSLLLDMLLG